MVRLYFNEVKHRYFCSHIKVFMWFWYDDDMLICFCDTDILSYLCNIYMILISVFKFIWCWWYAYITYMTYIWYYVKIMLILRGSYRYHVAGIYIVLVIFFIMLTLARQWMSCWYVSMIWYWNDIVAMLIRYHHVEMHLYYLNIAFISHWHHCWYHTFSSGALYSGFWFSWFFCKSWFDVSNYWVRNNWHIR